jgi:sugar transferase (PEP-CTERM system associated)
MIRVFRHYIPRSLLILGTVEALIIVGAVYLGVGINVMGFNPTAKLLVGSLWPKALAYCALMILMMAGVGLYQRGLRDDLRGLMFRVAVAFFTGIIIIIVFAPFFPGLSIGSKALTVTFVTSLAGVALFRAITWRYADANLFKRRVLVIGAGQLATQIELLRRRSDWRDAALLGFVHIPGQEVAVDEAKVHRPKGRLADYARHLKVDQLVVAMREQSENFPLEQILDCKMAGIRVMDAASFFEQQTGRIKIEALTPSTIIFADGFIQAVLKTYLHRAFDVLVSVGLLLIAWPVMLATAFLIWLEDAGPVLYRQTRVGRDNRQFEILKFRSMRVDAERDGAVWANSGDARVTRVGRLIRKSRIDELPQLINVIRGDMSFVGPRPERPQFVEELEKKIPYYRVRHRVNPGITGWAQISYPYGASDRDALEKLQFDLYYIKNYSLFLDLMILIQTAQVILWGKGAR